MKICMFCITYNRPKSLSRIIECFLRQTHPQRELLILDDADQYGHQTGDGWQIVSVPRRFRTMGEKRNAAIAMASGDVDGYLCVDDDDVYLPHTLAAVNDSLEQGAWSQPRQVLEFNPDKSLKRCETYNRKNPESIAYHASWAYRRDALVRVGGYPWCMDEEYGLARNLRKNFGSSIDITGKHKPYYIYDRSANTNHFSTLGCDEKAYDIRGKEQIIKVPKIVPGWDINYAALAIPSNINVRVW